MRIRELVVGAQVLEGHVELGSQRILPLKGIQVRIVNVGNLVVDRNWGCRRN